LIAKWFKEAGFEPPKTLKTRTRSLSTDVALFVAADSTYFESKDESWAAPETQLAALREGRALFAGVSADGRYSVELRCIDGPRPLLVGKEYKSLLASTEAVLLDAQSGTFSVGAPSSKERVDLPLEHGVYCVAAHALEGKTAPKIIVVVSATDQGKARNEEVSAIAELLA
jgi:hypothetical protein